MIRPPFGLPISIERQAFLEGTRKGIISQIGSEGSVIEMTMELDLVIRRRKVKGTGIVYHNGYIHHMILCGIFRNDRFLKIDYDNKLSQLRQFGCFLFDLDQKDERLVGRFVGYGHVSKSIVQGTCSLKKT